MRAREDPRKARTDLRQRPLLLLRPQRLLMLLLCEHPVGCC